MSSLAASARGGDAARPTPSVYYGYVLAERAALALAFGALGAPIAWGRSADRLGLFVSLALLLFGTQNDPVSWLDSSSA